jgi:hypothetical protein
MAARVGQETLPSDRRDIFSHPTQDDSERPKDKAQLLKPGGCSGVVAKRFWTFRWEF